MPQGLSPAWDIELDPEPLLFDEEFYNSLLKDLELSPAITYSADKSSVCSSFPELESAVDQLEFVTGLLLDEGDTGVSEPGCNHEKTPDLDYLWDSLTNLDDLEKIMNEKFTSAVSQCSLLADFENGTSENGAAHPMDSSGSCSQLEPDVKVEHSSSEDEDSISTGSSTLSSSDSEEEIDVVTVERQKALSEKRNSCTEQIRRSETRAQRLAAIKRSNLEIQLQHNYAAPCPAALEPKRPRAETAGFKGVRKRKNFDVDEEERHVHTHFKCANKSRSPSSRSCSDMEEEERRRTHNVLERQRRNELKVCFLKLRDEVPDLLNKEKASKVVILQQARDYIMSLQDEEHQCTLSRDRLQRKQEQLKRRLEHLKRTK